MDKNISIIIASICQKHGIEYQNINPERKKLCIDAIRIGEIVKEIESLIDELDEIFIRHNMGDGFKEKLEKDLTELHEIDHDLIKLAIKIKNE